MAKNRHRCPICGSALPKDYKYMGRCAKHQTTEIPDITLTEEAKRARSKGMSYGKYMVMKKEEGKA